MLHPRQTPIGGGADPVLDTFQYEAALLIEHLRVLLEVGRKVIRDLPPLPCPQLGTQHSLSIAPGAPSAVPLPPVAPESLQGAGWVNSLGRSHHSRLNGVREAKEG